MEGFDCSQKDPEPLGCRWEAVSLAKLGLLSDSELTLPQSQFLRLLEFFLGSQKAR